MLYGHALELTLKSLLVSQGSTSKRLKRIGHDLGRALRAASRLAPFKNIPVSERDRVVIAGLAGHCRDHAIGRRCRLRVWLGPVAGRELCCGRTVKDVLRHPNRVER